MEGGGDGEGPEGGRGLGGAPPGVGDYQGGGVRRARGVGAELVEVNPGTDLRKKLDTGEALGKCDKTIVNFGSLISCGKARWHLLIYF